MFGLLYALFVGGVATVGGIKAHGENEASKQQGREWDARSRANGEVEWGYYIDRRGCTRLLKNDQIINIWKLSNSGKDSFGLAKYGRPGDTLMIDKDYKFLRNLSAEQRALDAKKGK